MAEERLSVMSETDVLWEAEGDEARQATTESRMVPQYQFLSMVLVLGGR
jgi:hypothetical protein